MQCTVCLLYSVCEPIVSVLNYVCAVWYTVGVDVGCIVWVGCGVYHGYTHCAAAESDCDLLSHL